MTSHGHMDQATTAQRLAGELARQSEAARQRTVAVLRELDAVDRRFTQR